MSNMFSFAANFNVENSPVGELLWVILITDGKLDIANTNCNSNTVYTVRKWFWYVSVHLFYNVGSNP
ncbi:MAG: hypothetical protein AB8V19_05310 [Candidatus Midichloria sp.]|uniref:Uncharacterized protein n=1 Tax=Hyalomma marginatum TaxID=34627 RepID=A0A8S4C577_9ACAR|nr:hypothetical protein MHYMCMPSP_01122 [Hyalomma marginatum]CAG7600214.1 hypothetical protein MHYMCMPASI_01161 [Hyalomma marginatum]